MTSRNLIKQVFTIENRAKVLVFTLIIQINYAQQMRRKGNCDAVFYW